jgi:plasmid stabilization system protein ParE
VKKVVWTPSAARDLRLLHDSYSAFATKAVANRILSTIIKRADELATYPLLGRKRDDISHG